MSEAAIIVAVGTVVLAVRVSPCGRPGRAEGAGMLRIGSIVWGARDVPRVIEFWSAALGYRPLREPSGDWAILVPNEGQGAQLAITQVSSLADSHQRHHL